MQRFTDLKVWQRSHSLVREFYRVTITFPQQERFGLVPQMRRAVVSVATNIAEGSERRHNCDFARFLNIAEASLAEAEYLLLLSSDLRYVSRDRLERLASEIAQIARMLHALRARVENSSQ